jgi:hypothetical protein
LIYRHNLRVFYFINLSNNLDVIYFLSPDFSKLCDWARPRYKIGFIYWVTHKDQFKLLVNTVINFTFACNTWNILCKRTAVVVWKTAWCYYTNCFSYFGKQKIFFFKLQIVFQHSVCKKDDRTDCNNYLVITNYQLQTHNYIQYSYL